MKLFIFSPDCPGYAVGVVIDDDKVQELSGCTRITPGGITITDEAGFE